jgi:hypothetical protein
MGMAGMGTMARTTTQHPPPLLQATAHRMDGGVQGPGPGPGPGPGWGWSTPHTGGKTDDNGNEGGTNNIRTGNKGWGPGI